MVASNYYYYYVLVRGGEMSIRLRDLLKVICKYYNVTIMIPTKEINNVTKRPKCKQAFHGSISRVPDKLQYRFVKEIYPCFAGEHDDDIEVLIVCK